MRKIDMAWIIGTLVVTTIAYLSSMNIFITAAIMLIYLLYYFLLARKKFTKYLKQQERVHSCYHFINSFLVTLSVKESFEDAYESAIRIENKEFKEQVDNINNLAVYDRVSYLRGYFDLAIYKIFLNILDLYQDQGGNILAMSENLIRECTRTEKTITEATSIGNKHLIEFFLLWLMSFAIIIFMRFSISEFYMMMIKQPVFMIMLFAFFLICLASVHLFFRRFTNLTIKEDKGQ